MKQDALQDWACGERFSLAIVFTGVLSSTALSEALGDTAMREVRHAHFAQSRKLLAQHHGWEVKTIGYSFMVLFKSATDVLAYALALQAERAESGHPKVQILAGIHVGLMGSVRRIRPRQQLGLRHRGRCRSP